MSVPTFNSGQYTVNAAGQLNTTSNNIVVTTNNQSGGFLRAAGQTVTYIPTDAVKTVQGLPNLPLINNASVSDVAKAFQPPPDTGLTGVLKNITGVDLKNVTAQSSLQVLKAEVGDQLDVLQKMIEQEIIDCINSQLLTLSRKNFIASLLLNYEIFKSRILGGFQQFLTRKFNAFVNDLLFKKLQIQRLALLRQQILAEIRKLCPNASPTAIRNYATNPTSIATTALGSSSTLAASLGSQITSLSPTSSKGWKDLI